MIAPWAVQTCTDADRVGMVVVVYVVGSALS